MSCELGNRGTAVVREERAEAFVPPRVGGVTARSTSSCRSAVAVSDWLTGVCRAEMSHVCHLGTARVASEASKRRSAIRFSPVDLRLPSQEG